MTTNEIIAAGFKPQHDTRKGGETLEQWKIRLAGMRDGCYRAAWAACSYEDAVSWNCEGRGWQKLLNEIDEVPDTYFKEIITLRDAVVFFLTLYFRGEIYHPEESALDIVREKGQAVFQPHVAEQLNWRMTEAIENVAWPDDKDPCEFILWLADSYPLK